MSRPRRWYNVVESSKDAIIVQALDSTLVSLNPSAERLFGYSAAELIGCPVTVLFPPELVEQEAILQAKLSRGERVEAFETVRCRKDGSRMDCRRASRLSTITQAR